MNILLLGGTGFIGNYLYEGLAAKHQVHRTYLNSAIDNGICYNPALSVLDDIVGPDYDLVINNINPLYLDYASALKLTTDIIFYCKKNHISLLQVSSISADEQNKFTDSYSMKKHIADEVTIAELQGHNYTILRYPQIFDSKGIAKKSQAGLYYIIDNIRKGEALTLFANAGQMMRNYMHVNVLVDSINYAIDMSIKGVHNVFVPDHTKSLYDIINIICGFSPGYNKDVLLRQGDKTGVTYYLPELSDKFAVWSHSFDDIKNYLSKTYDEYR